MKYYTKGRIGIFKKLKGKKRARFVNTNRVVRSYKRAAKTSLRSILNGFPTKYWSRHRFVHSFHMKPETTAGPPAAYWPVKEVAQLNAIYDPFSGGNNDAVANYERMFSIYNRNTPVGVKIKMSWDNDNTSSTPPMYFGFFLSYSGDEVGRTKQIQFTQDLLEQKNTTYSKFTAGIVNDGKNGNSCSKYVSFPKFNGMDMKSYLAANNSYAEYHTKPTLNFPFGEFFVAPVAQRIAPIADVNFRVELTYTVLWTLMDSDTID